MTKAEALYWKSYIERVITSRLSALTDVEVDAAKIRTFADRHMLLITGQQMLPQSIFREFCEEFAPISEWQEQLKNLMEEFDGPYVALTDAEMDAICGISSVITLPNGRLTYDASGFVIADKVPVNEHGYIVVKELRYNNGYVIL